MALLVMIFRKMVKNKWLELSLLIGLTLSVALVSSMPIYTKAILERMLVKDLENLQHVTGVYPGKHLSNIRLAEEYKPEQVGAVFHSMDQFISKVGHEEFGLPVLNYVRGRESNLYKTVPVDSQRADSTQNDQFTSIMAMSDLESHIRLIDGKLPSVVSVNGVWETLVTTTLLNKYKMVLGTEFVMSDPAMKKPIRIKPVGVFERKDFQDPYWEGAFSGYETSFFVSFNLFEKEITEGRSMELKAGFWYFAFDYSKLKLETVPSYLAANEKIEQFLATKAYSRSMNATAVKTIDTYFEKEKRLRLMLWSLNVPVMIMLGFYLYMVANLITDRQKNEIAVLRSRGASRWQIILGYAIEGILLGVVALLVGPFVGMVLTKLLGASNGFLEFVQRTALHVELSTEAYKYASITVALSLVLTLIPAFLATRVTIVGHKQQVSRAPKLTFWHKFGIDLGLVALAIYGLQNFRRRMDDLLAMGLDSLDFKVDPLLFLIPALFMLGFGLFVLRLYPWVIRFIYWCGKKVWPPSLYTTLIQVGRSPSQYQFIMVFLIITMSTGLFSASAARTMNQNMEDQIRYKNGADITLKITWQNDAPPPSDGMGEGAPPPTPATQPKKVQYSEPPFLPFTEMAGVESAAKVFNKKEAGLNAGKTNSAIQLMGIDTDEFGRVAWMRDGLLDHHINEYLNLIAADPSAVLISRSIADELGLKPGDRFSSGWAGLEWVQFNVYGIIDFWPGWNPYPASPVKPATTSTTNTAGKAVKVNNPKLVVGHLSYIQNNLALEPYEVWLKLKPETTSAELYATLEQSKVQVTELYDVKQLLINQKSDPFRLAINGVMTLGFLISILISLFGFLLYWILSLTGRILQFGILRAMGISFWQLIGMLTYEQLLTSGAGVLIGIATGLTTSKLFVPLFKVSFNPATQVPPFQVTFDKADQLQLYVVSGFMLTLGLLILGWMLSRVKIHQAVKLGED